jgi:branched-chain amino acid transport system permease protein
MAGALFTYYVGVTFPQFAFDPVVDVNLTLMAFLGGLGTLAGPILGAVLVEPLQQYLTLQFGANSLNLILFGSLLLVILLVLPRGIVPSLRDRWRTLRAARQARLQSAHAANQERPVLVEKGER